MGITLGSIAVIVGSLAGVWYQWNQQITKTNQEGLKQTGSQWADFFQKQKEGQKTLGQTTQEFKSAYAGINQTIKDGGFAGLFIDKKGLALQGLKEMEALARSGAKSYQEYAGAVMEAAKATGMIQGGYQFGKGSSMEDAAAYQFLTQQVGMLNDQQFMLAQGSEAARAGQDLYTYSMMQYNAAAGSTIQTQEQMIEQRARQAEAEASFQQQLSSARGIYDEYKSAIGQVQEAEQRWMSQTGSELVDYLGKKLPEGSELWRQGMGAIDEAMGSNYLKTFDTRKEYENLMIKFADDKDVESLKTALKKLREDGLETVRKGMEDVIKKAQTLYQELLNLPETIRIHIEFSADSPAAWINEHTPGHPGGGGQALGGPVYPGYTYLVGEEGPEPFRPFSAGYVERSDKAGRGKAQVVLQANINNNIDMEELLYRMMQRLQEQMA